MSEIEKQTMDEVPPLFKSWNSWYILIVIGNILFTAAMLSIFSQYN